jgi:aminopeptidase N
MQADAALAVLAPLRAAARITLALAAACANPPARAATSEPPCASLAPSNASQSGAGARAQHARQPEAGALEIGDPYFPGLGNGGYDVEHYRLELDIDMSADEFEARAAVRARALSDLASFSLDLYGLEVERVLVDGQEARFERPAPAPSADGKKLEPGELVIHPAQPLRSGAWFETVVEYSGSPEGRPDPAVPFLPGVGWSWTESGVYVVSECIGASSWFPCNDHPRDKATYEFHVTVDEPYTAAANGILRQVVEDGDERTFVFDARDPMATYLVTLNVAEFGQFELEGPRGIPVVIYHPLDATEDELDDFRRQPEVLAFLETVFGPYPFEAAGGVLSYEQIGGALECQTLPVYGRGCGLEVIVHELAHQWFGDCVSPDLWRDMWLNEGFASYSEWLWDEHVGGRDAYVENVKRTYHRLRSRKTASPFDPGVERVFSGRVYMRGAMVLHGLRTEVGDETFFRILKEWVAENHDGNGDTHGFVRHSSAVAGRDLSAFFDAWLFGALTPEIPEFGPDEPAPEGAQGGG